MTKRKTAKQKDLEKEIQQVLEQFEFDDETRRKIFSLVLEVAQEKVQKPQKKKGSQNDQR
jgi:hypothetical protein